MPSAPPTRLHSTRRRLLGLAPPLLAPTVQRRSHLPGRVLLLRPDHIGDVLLTSPALALLRGSLPDAHITYLVGPWSMEAARHGPPVDRLWSLPFPGFTRRPAASIVAPYVLLARQAVRLRRECFDLAIVFRPDHWWGALLALAAGIPVRVGGQVPETSPLLTHARHIPANEHAADSSLSLTRLALQAFAAPAQEPPRELVFVLSHSAQASADRLWLRASLGDQRVVVLHPNAGAALKSWPIQNWAALANGLHGLGLAVVLVGAPADGPLLEAIQARMARPPAFTARGQSLADSAAIYARSSLLIGLDSGAAHLASAVGTPTLRLYGPAASDVFGPWPARPDQRVLATRDLSCVPCGYLATPPCGARTLPACLLALDVSQVLNAASRQLDHLNRG